MPSVAPESFGVQCRKILLIAGGGAVLVTGTLPWYGVGYPPRTIPINAWHLSAIGWLPIIFCGLVAAATLIEMVSNFRLSPVGSIRPEGLKVTTVSLAIMLMSIRAVTLPIGFGGHLEVGIYLAFLLASIQLVFAILVLVDARKLSPAPGNSPGSPS